MSIKQAQHKATELLNEYAETGNYYCYKQAQQYLTYITQLEKKN